MTKKISWQLKAYKHLFKFALGCASIVVLFLIINFTQQAKMIFTGTLTVSLDSTSPAKQILLGGTVNNTVAVFKLSAGSVENLDLDEVTLTDTGSGTLINYWYLYSSIRSDGGDINAPIAAGVAPDFIIANDTVVIPAGGNALLTVKAALQPIPVFAANGDNLTVSVSHSADIKVTGKISTIQLTDDTSVFPINAVTHVAYGARPVVSLAIGSPSGPLPGGVSPLAKFSVLALGDNLDFVGANGNSLTIYINSNCSDVGSRGILRLYDANIGTIYDTISNVNLCDPGYYTFDFSDNNLVIATGSTKSIGISGDVSGFSVGDVIQVILKDNDPANIGWGIRGDNGNYQAADVVFRNNIFGNWLIAGFGSSTKPVFNLAPDSPSGFYASGVRTPLAYFDVLAQGDDITFDGPTGSGPNAGNTLTVDVASVCDGLGSAGNLILEDKTHTQLDAIAGVNLCVPGSYTFDFSDADLSVTNLGSDKLYIYGDTTSNNINGIYIWLNGDDPNNIDWSVNYDDGNYHKANIIYGSGIWGNVLVNSNPLSEAIAPSATITANTKTSDNPITDTDIVVRDNWAVEPSGVSFANSTAGIRSINCVETGINYVECTLGIISSGDLVVDVTDDKGNSVQASELGYVVTQQGGGGATNPILSQPEPTCVLSINNGASSTTSQAVNLLLTSEAQDKQMIISNNVDFIGQDWQSFSETSSWQLLNNTNGTKTVYAMVKDGAGRISPVCSDTIAYSQEETTPAEELPAQTVVITKDPEPAPPLPAQVQIGQLVKTAQSNAVYFIDNDNRKHLFTNESVYFSWFNNFDNIQIISDAIVDVIPSGSNVYFRSGTYLIKTINSAHVYVIEPYGVLRWLETEAIAQELYGVDWSKKVIDVDSLADYQLGAEIDTASYPNASLLQYAGSADIYYIENSKKRLVSTAVFTSNYFQDRFVVKSVSSQLAYQLGEILPAMAIDKLMTLK